MCRSEEMGSISVAASICTLPASAFTPQVRDSMKLSGTSLAAPTWRVCGLGDSGSKSVPANVDRFGECRPAAFDRHRRIGDRFPVQPNASHRAARLERGRRAHVVQPLNTTSLTRNSWIRAQLLKYYVVGASYCYAAGGNYQNRNYCSSSMTVGNGSIRPSCLLAADAMEHHLQLAGRLGQYPFARGLAARRIFLGCGTGASDTNMQWQRCRTVPHHPWSVPASASFDQQHWNDGADSCEGANPAAWLETAPRDGQI